MSVRGVLVSCLLGAVVAAARAARAQDVEMLGQAVGRTLPDGYYQRVQLMPEFFAFKRGWRARVARAREAGLAVSGTLPLVVVQGLFADSRQPPFTHQDIQRVLFDGPAMHGTLTEYYEEVSGGRLRLDGEALPWVRTTLSLSQTVAGSFGLGFGARTGEYLVNALQLADPTTDFGRFDNDGPDNVPNSGDDDGFVDAIAFQFLEAAASCGGPGIWPHKSRIAAWAGTPFTTDDARPGGGYVLIDDYIVQSATDCGGDRIQTTSTIAHELGHTLGLPDLYDSVEGVLPTLRNWVVGCWSLMAAGAWGCGAPDARTSVFRPPHMGPWEKGLLGWITTERLVGGARDVTLTLPPVQSSGEIVNVPLSDTEYLLVEFRDRMGFDRDLPLPGVLMYRIDSARPIRRCRTCDRLYHVALLEADGNAGLIRIHVEGGNRGEPGDVFGVAGRTTLGGRGTPSTRLNSGAPSDVTFYEIAIEDGVARLHLSTTTIALDDLVAPFAARGTLRQADEEYLDRVGNGNGTYDVGDLRGYLREHPSVLARAR